MNKQSLIHENSISITLKRNTVGRMSFVLRKRALMVICIVLEIALALLPHNVEGSITSSDIDNILEEFQKEIQYEKQVVPKTMRVEWEKEPMSITAAVELSGDTQRAFEYIAEKTNMTNLDELDLKDLNDALKNSSRYNDLVDKCTSSHKVPSCDANLIYRTFDGTCNNVHNPTWGSLLHRRRRRIPSSYEGLSGFRRSATGKPLPVARKLSINILTNVNRTTPYLSHMFTFFGQMLTHDITDTPLTRVNGMELFCCPVNDLKLPECIDIPVSDDDPFFSKRNVTCVHVVRNAPYRTCTFSKREHMNSVPAFIDAHFTYGRTEAEAKSLQVNDGSGLLLTQDSPHGPLMPSSISQDDLFCFADNITTCFRGGDARTNQHAVLMAIQTAWLREHNRMAKILKDINPDWNGTQIYHVSRKILGAKMQCIAFKEYLPLLLGDSMMDEYGLRIGTKYRYNETLDPSISAEFATFGFRLHSMTNTQIGEGGCARNKLRNVFVDPTSIHQGCAEDYLKGACQAPSQKFDRYFVPDITDYGIKFPQDDYGVDIAAMHVQRGRENGIPPYVDVVEHLKLTKNKIESFDDLQQIMSKENVDLLRNNYADVKDVDAWIGMTLENILTGSQLSPTSAYLSAEQFHRLKYGDRFYFENENQPWSFTREQIEELKKTTLSKLICDNAPNNQWIPAKALQMPDTGNPMKPCDGIPSVNLVFWKEASTKGDDSKGSGGVIAAITGFLKRIFG